MRWGRGAVLVAPEGTFEVSSEGQRVVSWLPGEICDSGLAGREGAGA